MIMKMLQKIYIPELIVSMFGTEEIIDFLLIEYLEIFFFLINYQV